MRNTLDFLILIFILQNVYLGIFICRKGSVITANSLFDLISRVVYSTLNTVSLFPAYCKLQMLHSMM